MVVMVVIRLRQLLPQCFAGAGNMSAAFGAAASALPALRHSLTYSHHKQKKKRKKKEHLRENLQQRTLTCV
jgi:hypothetical protein